MLTSPIYDSIHALLTTRLPQALASQVTTLALVLVGVLQSISAQIGQIAQAMPLTATQVIKEQRIRRLLSNPRFTQEIHYQPLIRDALHGLKGQRVNLLIDRVLLQDHHNILVVSIGFRRRSLPVSWVALSHRGQSGLADQQAVLTQALALLPPRVRVTVHGDSEFRSGELFTWLRALGCDVMLGVIGKMLVTADPQTAPTPLATWLCDSDTRVYLADMYVFAERQGPVSILAWWERDPDGSLVVRGAVTNLPATHHTYLRGRRRMWIETTFRDWQSGGFQLDRSRLTDRQRMARLLIVLAIAYLWFVSLGRWVVKRGYRRLLDDGPTGSWHYSLFQLGIGWQRRLQSCSRPMPLIETLYV